jgi:hypothetical protein
VKRLAKVKDELLVDTADARTLAEELQASVDPDNRGPWRLFLETDFEAVEPRRWRESTLTKTLLGSVRDEAASLHGQRLASGMTWSLTAASWGPLRIFACSAISSGSPSR